MSQNVDLFGLKFQTVSHSTHTYQAYLPNQPRRIVFLECVFFPTPSTTAFPLTTRTSFTSIRSNSPSTPLPHPPQQPIPMNFSQVYEYAITFSSEMTLIWNAPWSLVKVLFILARYIGVVETGIILYSAFYRLF